MERRFEVRTDELMAECDVSPGMLDGVMGRLKRFVEPFAVSLCRQKEKGGQALCRCAFSGSCSASSDGRTD